MGDELALMWRDLTVIARAGAWPIFLIVFGLPLSCLALLARRQWFALLPASISIALAALWFTYYARDWTEEAVGDWAGFIVGGLGTGWLLVLVCVVSMRLARRS